MSHHLGPPPNKRTRSGRASTAVHLPPMPDVSTCPPECIPAGILLDHARRRQTQTSQGGDPYTLATSSAADVRSFAASMASHQYYSSGPQQPPPANVPPEMIDDLHALLSTAAAADPRTGTAPGVDRDGWRESGRVASDAWRGK